MAGGCLACCYQFLASESRPRDLDLAPVCRKWVHTSTIDFPEHIDVRQHPSVPLNMLLGVMIPCIKLH
eukprot:13910188-Ditylum_brightwellii.AAC.1